MTNVVVTLRRETRNTYFVFNNVFSRIVPPMR